MNLDYYITNEFGEKVLSNDPTVGIPTKGKYRFKVKWQQPPTLSEQTRRPYYLLPNVKEYGWSYSSTSPTDPINYSPTNNLYKQANSSYYFGLAWSGYTDGFVTPTIKNRRLNEIVNVQRENSAFKTKLGLNKIHKVLIEGFSKKSDEFLMGRNTQNTVVVFPKENYKKGDYVNVLATDCTPSTLIGKVI
jgi:hypothetical protein